MSDFRSLIERPEWMERGACRNVAGDMFFPARGEKTSTAKAICAGCPVRAECLAYALTLNERFGIWGGLSERERRRIRSARAKKLGLTGNHRLPGEVPPPIEHGAKGGAMARIRRGEEPCVPCKEAHAAAERERRAKRMLKAVAS